MPYQESLIQAIADRHGLSGTLTLLPKGGMVNEAWDIGGTHILRIVTEGNDKECDDECARESRIVPLLVSAGVKTPALVAFDESFAPRPYTIYERADGETVGFCPVSYEDFENGWRELGRDLFHVHQIELSIDSRDSLYRSKGPDYPKWVARAVERGAIDQATADDICAHADRWTELGGPAQDPCLIHNDAHPWNLMGDPATGSLTAILDWGDASIGDPANDFAMMPLPCVPAMIRGYEEAGGRGGIELAARALVVGLSVSLFEVSTPEMREFDRRWWRMPPGGWDEMKALAEELWPELS